jgi:Sulfotransferase family
MMIGAPLSRLLSGLYVDLGKGDHRSSVFLAGSGRSGTTWLSEIINHRRKYRYVFEPFNPREVGPFGHFRTKQYLRPDDQREGYLDPARLALTGALRDPWTDRFNGRIVARRRLIKDIRANLVLGWIRANFPGMPIILLLRHPCAVVVSRLALGWRDNLSETMEQRELVEDFLLPMEAEIRAARGDFERHLFLWCIDNYVPMKQLGPQDLHLTFYEDLLVRPQAELQSLFTFLGEDFDDRLYRRMRRLSPLGRKNTCRPSLEGWRTRVSDHQLQRTMEILRLFGLDHLYGEGTMPDPSCVLMDGV